MLCDWDPVIMMNKLRISHDKMDIYHNVLLTSSLVTTLILSLIAKGKICNIRYSSFIL